MSETSKNANASPGYIEEVELQGHIIDSLLLPKVLDEILTRGGSYVIKDIRIGQRQIDPSYARIEVTRRLRRDACTKSSTPSTITAPCRPSTHDCTVEPADMDGAFPRASTARPTIARRSGSAANGSRWKIRRWIAASSSIPKERAARCLAMIAVQEGRPHRRRPAGLRVLPAETAAPAEPVRVHGQPGVQRKAQGRDGPRDRRRHAAHDATPAKRSSPCSAPPSSTPAASSTSAS